jgi:2-methylcitrate dehydratase PrpD
VAIALSIASAGGVQRAFGTTAKSLQVAAAVEAGLRAAVLAEAGAGADVGAVDDWMRLVRGDPDALQLDGPAVPGGLAVKLYPCCYALQRPIATLRELGAVAADSVERVRVRAPAGTLTPLIHHDPQTGLEAKFSLEYGVAAALLDGRPGFDSFSDAGVARPAARRLMQRVEAVADGTGGQGLLAGAAAAEVELSGGEMLRARLELPPGAPQRPLGAAELEGKLRLCAPDAVDQLSALTWETAPAFMVTLLDKPGA